MALVVRNLHCNTGDIRDMSLIPGVGKIPWRREWLPTPAFLPGKFQEQRSLRATVYGVTKELDRT